MDASSTTQRHPDAQELDGGEVRVPVAPMTAESFAPYGRVFGLEPKGRERAMLATGFEHDGKVTLSTIWNPVGGHRFTRLERHFGVTQAFVQLSGAPAVVCVAPPTDRDDLTALPRPEDVVGFLIDPAQGYLFRRGTWHSLDRCVLAPPGATFLIINSDPNPTQMVDFARGTSALHPDLDGPEPPQTLPWPGLPRTRFVVAL